MDCSKCGEKNPKDYKFCQKCGKPLSERPSKLKTPAKETKNILWLYISIIAVIAVVAVILVFFLMQNQSGTPLGNSAPSNSGAQGVLLAPETALLAAKVDMKGMLTTLQKDSAASMFLSNTLLDMYRQNGVDLNKITDIVLIYSQSASFNGNGAVLMYGSFDKTLVISKMINQWNTTYSTVHQEDYKGITLYKQVYMDTLVTGLEAQAFAVVSDNLFIQGGETTVKSTIDRIQNGASTSIMDVPSINKVSTKLGSYPSQMFIRVTPEYIEQMGISISGFSKDTLKAINAIGVGFGDDRETKIVLLCSDESSADKVRVMMEYIKTEAAPSSMTSLLNMTKNDPVAKSFVEKLNDIWSKAQVSVDGNFVIFTMPPSSAELIALWQMGMYTIVYSSATSGGYYGSSPSGGGVPLGSCGDGICNAAAETYQDCPQDCPSGVAPTDNDIATAMAAGSPVECDITIASDSDTVTANAKIAYPKFKETVNSAGTIATIISDGTNMYMNSLSMGNNVWYKMELDQTSTGAISPDDLRNSLQQPPAGTTINCRLGSFSDNEFQLPAGAQVQDFSTLSTDSSYGVHEVSEVNPTYCQAYQCNSDAECESHSVCGPSSSCNNGRCSVNIY